MEYKIENLPVNKPASHPSGQKMEDSLLNKVNMTTDDCELLNKILENYE